MGIGLLIFCATMPCTAIIPLLRILPFIPVGPLLEPGWFDYFMFYLPLIAVTIWGSRRPGKVLFLVLTLMMVIHYIGAIYGTLILRALAYALGEGRYGY